MAWTFTDDVAAYGAAAGGLLSSEPERHTVLLSVLATLTSPGPTAFGPMAPLLGWGSDGETVTAAVLQTPPYPLLTTSLDGRPAAQLAAVTAGPDGRNDRCDQRHRQDRAGLYAAQLAWPRLRRRRHRSDHRARQRPGSRIGGSLHRPGEPDKQLALPEAGL